MEKLFEGRAAAHEEKAGRGTCSPSQIDELEPLGNQGVSKPEIDPAPEPRHLRFERVNEVTVKVADGRITITPTPPGRHWAGYKTTRAVAWLAAVGGGRWVVRYRNKTSRPMILAKARRYASELIKGIRPGIVLDDPIAHLNQITATVLGANEKWHASIESDLLDYIREVETGVPPLRHPHDPTPEALQGESGTFDLEFYEDGYPKLPAFLDRRLARGER